MNEPELVRQVIQGGGNMPAYGNNLTPAGGQSPGFLSRFSPTAQHDPALKPGDSGKNR